LIGGKDVGKRGKFFAGLARACLKCDAVIIDSCLSSGVEKYCERRGLKLIGIAPENEVKIPKLNPTY